jgi:hypothetical protein
MRLFALFLCLFLLIISCGTLTYVYLLWNTYWLRVAKLTEERNYFRQQHQTAVRVLETDDQVKYYVSYKDNNLGFQIKSYLQGHNYKLTFDQIRLYP